MKPYYCIAGTLSAAVAAMTIAMASIASPIETLEILIMSDKPNGRLLRGYTDGPYGQIHYRIVKPSTPTAIPQLALHASPLSGIVFDNWLREIGRDRLALAPDTPGYGGSDPPPNPVGIPEFADAMIAFLDNFGIEQVDVMGYHTGSLTSVDLATRYPERIRKVILISAPIFDENIIAEYRERIYQAPPKFEDMLATTAKNIRANGKGMFQDVPTDERFADISIERIRQYRTNNWGFRAAFSYDLRTALSKVEQPTLVLNPEDDLWELTPAAIPFLKNGRIHDLPGWTHGHLDAHTAEMAAVVRAFLDEE